jgi:hypothetical protein
MSYKFAITVPAPGLVQIARQAEEYGLEVVIGPDPDDSDAVVLTVNHDRDERDEAVELESLAEQAWDDFEE